MKDLIKRVLQLREGEIELTSSSYSKFPGWMNLRAGSKISIDFGDGIIDRGYIFLLPEHEASHTLDALLWEGIVHIPEPYCEKEVPEPEWVLLVDLLNNDQIKHITILD